MCPELFYFAFETNGQKMKEREKNIFSAAGLGMTVEGIMARMSGRFVVLYLFTIILALVLSLTAAVLFV